MAYTKTNWENLPSTNTPITASNLNNIENQVDTNTTDIADLTSDVATNTGNIATNASNITTNTNDINNLKQDTGWVNLTNGVRYRKKGNVVTVIGENRGAFNLPVNAYTQVAVLPTEVRPSTTLMSGWNPIGRYETGTLQIVSSTGSIDLYNEGNEISYWCFVVTYVI